MHVLAGYKPKPPLLVERKIYEVHRLSVRGWRRSGRIAVEVNGWRHHEADWFDAMQGVKLRISDPALPGPHNEETDFIVTRTSFDRKMVVVNDEKGRRTEQKLYEGTLDVTETWPSALRRQRAEMLNLGFKWLFAPLFAALGAGITLLWFEQSTGIDGQPTDARDSTAVIEEPSTPAVTTDPPPAQPAVDPPAGETTAPADDTQTTTDSGNDPALSATPDSQTD